MKNLARTIESILEARSKQAFSKIKQHSQRGEAQSDDSELAKRFVTQAEPEIIWRRLKLKFAKADNVKDSETPYH